MVCYGKVWYGMVWYGMVWSKGDSNLGRPLFLIWGLQGMRDVMGNLWEGYLGGGYLKKIVQYEDSKACAMWWGTFGRVFKREVYLKKDRSIWGLQGMCNVLGNLWGGIWINVRSIWWLQGMRLVFAKPKVLATYVSFAAFFPFWLAFRLVLTPLSALQRSARICPPVELKLAFYPRPATTLSSVADCAIHYTTLTWHIH